MPKRKKRELQHLRQESTRKRSYQLGNTSPSEIYKPGFPMNIFSNVRLFALIGVVVIVSFIVAAILTSQLQNSSADQVDVPSPTPVPTLDPSATVSATTTTKSFTAADKVVDPAKQYTATIKTSKGDIVVKLYADKAPNTVNSFVFLAQKGFFDGIAFHRVVKNFVVQGGDPTGSGSGGPGYTIPCECYSENHRNHFRGTLSMAHAGKDTGGSQFFLTFRPTAHLNGKHTVFGRVIEGFDVITKLKQRDPEQQGVDAVEPDKILEAKVLRKRDHEYKPETKADK